MESRLEQGGTQAMNDCPEHEKNLWLDILGELSVEEAPQWQAHLQHCQRCRREWERSQTLLQQVKTATSVPHLTPEQRRDITTVVTSRLHRDRAGSNWGHLFTAVIGRSRSAAVALAIVLIVCGWIGYQTLYATHKTAESPLFTAVSPQIDEMHLVEDLELISNLELLEEITTLQKLVHLEEEQSRIPPFNQQSQQMRPKNNIYACLN
jgi:hypothetical protein